MGSKQFDPDVALERAMQAFWAKGYEATSAQDLVDAMGINRGSLYATFGNKAELYRRALRRYRCADLEALRRSLGGPGEFRTKLRAILQRSAEQLVCDPDRRGCFLVNATTEMAPRDATVGSEVRLALDDVQQVLEEAVKVAQQRGELDGAKDPEALAAFFVTAMQGLRLVGKGTQDPRRLGQAIEVVLSTLD